MYKLKAFAAIDSLVSNVANIVAPIGELSTYACTFTRDKKIYASGLDSSITIHAFKSVNTDSGDMAPPNTILTLSHDIVHWIYTRQMASNVTESRDSFLSALNQAFSSRTGSINCGDLIAAINNKQFPQWIIFNSTEYTTHTNEVTIWFSDESFRQKYDEYELSIIAPVTNIAVFQSTASNVTAALNAVGYTSRIDRITQVRQQQPETVLVGVTYQWVDPNNTNNRINTDWTVLIYGPYGNDADVIREAIAQYLLDNSTSTESQWRSVFPDIFTRTEFLFFPRWHNYAIENMTLQAGLYSPVLYFGKETTYLQDILVDYSDAFITNHISGMVVPYKSLATLIIGGENNRSGAFDITTLHPDILNVSNTSVDFNRMSQSTKELLTKIYDMILIAENLTQYSDIPIGYRKVTRYNILFVSTRYLNVEYLVASKLTTPTYD